MYSSKKLHLMEAIRHRIKDVDFERFEVTIGTEKEWKSRRPMLLRLLENLCKRILSASVYSMLRISKMV